MKRTNILLAFTTLLLAILLLISHLKNRANNSGVNSDQVIETILTRTSVRSYQDKPVEEDKILNMLKAGMAAPTAMNKQPWHFVVVTDKEQLIKLSEANPYAAMAEKAPLAIVVCGDMRKAIEGGGRDFWIQDASAATQNILLAAHSMGLGAVWTGSYPSEEICQSVAQILSLPSYIIPLNTIVIGYPAGESSPKDKWKIGNISYNTFGGEFSQSTTNENNTTASTDELTDKNDNMIQKRTFTTFDYTDDFDGNPFTWFKGAGLLLAVGDKQSHNAMTIGWGSLGNVWGSEVNTITVYVAPSRYTYQFMEKYKYFTVMTFDKEHKDILAYMGSHSGRDGDKAKALGLHTAYTENGAPYYLEASEVYECEIIYKAPFDPEGFTDIPKKRYENSPSGIHHLYIGKIISAKRF